MPVWRLQSITHNWHLVMRCLFCKCMRTGPGSPAIEVFGHTQQSLQLHIINGSSIENSSGSLWVWTSWVPSKQVEGTVVSSTSQAHISYLIIMYWAVMSGYKAKFSVIINNTLKLMHI